MALVAAWFIYALATSLAWSSAPFLLASFLMWSLWAAFIFWLITRLDRRQAISAGIRAAVFAWSAMIIQLTGVAVALSAPPISEIFGRFGIAVNAPVEARGRYTLPQFGCPEDAGVGGFADRAHHRQDKFNENIHIDIVKTDRTVALIRQINGDRADPKST